MKYLMTLALFSLLFVPFTAKADIAPEPGYHRVYSCAYFDNLADYPAYNVYETSSWRFGPSAIDAKNADDITADLTGDYGCGNTGTPFFAVKKSDEAKITHQADDERGDFWDTLDVNKPYFIDATVTGTPRDYADELVYGNMPDTNRTVYFVTTYHIDALTDDTFTAHIVTKAQYDKNGTVLSETTDNSTVVTTTTNSTVAIVLLVVIAVVAGGFLFALRRPGGNK